MAQIRDCGSRIGDGGLARAQDGCGDECVGANARRDEALPGASIGRAEAEQEDPRVCQIQGGQGTWG